MNDDPPDLLTPMTLGDLALPNRMVMAPMTRNRAGDDRIPGALHARYYAQRASAALIITEASQVSEVGIGYPATPGIRTEAQVEGWRQVTDAVHRDDGRVFLQLWHVGRISHPSFQPDGERPVAPSAVRPEGEAKTEDGPQPFVTPRALDTDEIPSIVEQFGHAARLAREAGFDGVEVHAANGYLIDQFLRDGTNRRDDRYGGPVANRARFLLEILDAVTGVWPAHRVGVRLSPSGTFNDMSDSDPETTFGFVAAALDPLGLSYLHVVEANDEDLRHGATVVPTRLLRTSFRGVMMVNGDYDRDRGNAVIQRGEAELVSFARLFLANPDLPERFATGAALNEPDPDTFYGGGAEGYVDYPTLS